MFVVKSEKAQIKVWLDKPSDIEPGCLEQAKNVANLPFIFHHVALMPDTHQGYGMPIGGVACLKDVLCPNMVGVDIGCGMNYVETNINVGDVSKKDMEKIIDEIYKVIPVGFSHQANALELPETLGYGPEKNEQLRESIFPSIQKQLGTLGGGNHFIELQRREDNNKLCIMLHSGSRNVGKQVCDCFNSIAKDLNKKFFSAFDPKYDLAFLPIGTKKAEDYFDWMTYAMNFAYHNREHMMNKIKEIVNKYLSTEFHSEINKHHNYASLENHYGHNVWVHRKGAISARQGEIGIIPGAMGSFSYIVEGLGNHMSYNSCSHGAGRRMGRKKAAEKFDNVNVLNELSLNNIVAKLKNENEAGEECMHAYKDIEMVMGNQNDLVKIIKKLKTIAVIKG